MRSYCSRCSRNQGKCTTMLLKLDDKETAMVKFAWKTNNNNEACLFYKKGTKSRTHTEY